MRCERGSRRKPSRASSRHGVFRGETCAENSAGRKHGMAADETKANLERVLAALTAGEQDQPAAPARECATPASAEPADAPQHNPAALLYQAKIDIKQRCLAGAEALMRAHDDASGALMPAHASG